MLYDFKKPGNEPFLKLKIQCEELIPFSFASATDDLCLKVSSATSRGNQIKKGCVALKANSAKPTRSSPRLKEQKLAAKRDNSPTHGVSNIEQRSLSHLVLYEKGNLFDPLWHFSYFSSP